MDKKIKSRFKSLLNGVLIIFVPVSIAIVLRVFFFEIYIIPSSSMEPSLLPGDIIIVSKMSYGARVLKPVKFFKQKKIEYIRTKGWSSVKKGDIFVFNWPNYNATFDSTITYYGDPVVKRCYGLPGDSVIIKNEGIKNEGMKELRIEGIKELNLFPHDSTLRWKVNNYGPLYVPAKGGSLELTKRNVSWYKDILLYENPVYQIKDSCLMTDEGERILQYSFKHNYYFMLGDNFYGSEDSRFWGFVPDANVIGKIGFVLFSIDPNENGFKKIRWKRIMKIL
jgi:signal peptidase I